jgi:hypothetical protein
MRIAIPVHDRRVSPVFDTAQPRVRVGSYCIDSACGKDRDQNKRVALRCHWRFGCGRDCLDRRTGNLIYDEEVTGDA